MTTRPQPTDPVNALTRADGTTAAHSTDHGRVIDIWENVKHHGATGNGTTDDTAAFAAAIAAVSTNGGVVFIPPGNYKITATLFLATNVQLRGAGPGSHLIHCAGSDPLIDIPAFTSQATCRDFAIYGPYSGSYGHAGTGTGHGIYVHGVAAGSQYVTRTSIDRIQFVGVGDATHWCVYGIWGIETHISRCDIVAANGGGIYLGDTCNNSTVSQNTASNNASGALGALFLDTPNGVHSHDNVWEAWRGSYAIKITDGSNHIIERDWLEDNSGTDLLITGTLNSVIRAMGGLDLHITSVGGLTLDTVTFQNIVLASVNTVNHDTNVLFHNSYATVSFSTAGLVNGSDRIIYHNAKNSNGVSPSGMKFTSGAVSSAIDLDMGYGLLTQAERTVPSTPSANILSMFTADDDGVTKPHFITADGVEWRVRGERAPVTLTDAATVAVNAAAGSVQSVNLTAARTFGAPSNPMDGQTLTLLMFQSTGAPVVPLWDAIYHLSSTALSLATGKRTSITFTYWKAAGVWYEVGRSTDMAP